jgi:hypothetical protein
VSYRAVPVAALFAGLTVPPDSVIEAVAVDGFAAQIPLDLMLNTDANKAVAWVATEPAHHPSPKIAGKDYTAGPFYIVWTVCEAAGVRSEYWAYQAEKLVSQPSPAARWPPLALDPSLLLRPTQSALDRPCTSPNACRAISSTEGDRPTAGQI